MDVPKSMDDCLYFTNRTIGEKGKIMAWCLRPDCTGCGKGKLGKPIKKNGKVDKKADYFECPKCKHNMSLTEAENVLKLDVIYTCPECGKSGETQTEYKRKSFKGVQSYVFVCKDCGANIAITKKLKEIKKK
ncbi:MAG: hypothetical protein ABIJ08_02995 [Nanoarchaeota archaeon]